MVKQRLPDADGAGIITSILTRDTELARPNYAGRSKPLASNFDRMAVVLAPEPEPVRYLLDQYLVAAEWIGVEAVIVLNKSDLLDDADWRVFRAAFDDYRHIGYALIDASAVAADGLVALTASLSGGTSVLVGQSGVGKSSITHRLVPDQEIQIGRLSAATGLGRHTTSTTTLYALPGGGQLIDSPGVRSFRLGQVDRATLERGFREFRAFLGHCRFSDCAHGDEPGCALREAAGNGAISATRLANFHHLLQSGRD